jgi:Fe-S cluster biosynthesis and repair protein YggX
MKQLLVLIFCMMVSNIQAQKKLSGKVVVAGSQMPIPAASIFLSNTSVGTISKEDGSFSIEFFPAGRYDLVVTILGYETYTIALNSTQLPDNLIISLQPMAKELQEVIVANYDKNGWDKWGDFFMEMLIGKTPNAMDCKLLNKDAVKFIFNKKENVLRAFATEPIRIRNDALGYDLSYELKEFEHNYKTRIFYYQGYPLFTQRKHRNNRQLKKWLTNRAETYEGSLMHFMRSLYKNSLVQDGFEIRRIKKQKTEDKNITINGQHPSKEIDILIDVPLNGDSIAFAIDSVTAGLQFADYLQVVYKHKLLPSMYVREIRNGTIGQPITARIVMPDPTKVISVLGNGSYFYGKDILTVEYWAWSEKLSNLLPLDYRK